MKSKSLFWLSASLLLAAAPMTLAKTYKWVDENGKVHYSDRVPPEQVKQAREEISSQGVSVKKIEAAKTPEEIAAAKAAAEAEALARRKAEEERRANLALVNSYATESDLIRNYEQNLELIEQQIISTNADIDVRQKNLDQLVARAAQSEQSGRAVDPAISTMIERERAEISKQKIFVESKAKDKAAAKADFDARLAQYRAAVAKAQGGATQK